MNRKTIILNSVLGVAALGAGVAGYTVIHGDSGSSVVTRTAVTVQRATVQTTVTGSGNLTPVTQVDVNFDGGVGSTQVAEIDVKVGDKVKKGQVLAKLDDRLLQSTLAAAKVSLAGAQASYDKARTGLTADDLAQLDAQENQSYQQVLTAQANLDNAKATADQNAVQTAESVRQAGVAYDNAAASTARDNTTAQAAYDTAKAAADTAQATVDKYTKAKDECSATPAPTSSSDGTSCTNVASLLTQAQTDLTAKTNALATQQSNLDGVKLKSKQTMDSAQNALNNAKNSQAAGALKDQQSIASAQRQLDTAKASYDSTVAANNVKRKTPTAADTSQQQVALINAQTALATAEKNAGNAVLVAPADGTVTAVNGKVGSNASATSSGGSGSSASGASGSSSGSTSNAFVQLSDVSAYQVKVGFGEADAAKVKAGQNATVTVEAANNARLNATVTSIDATSTVVSNVVTYYAYLTIPQLPSGVTLQPGLTASVSVVVQSAANVLELPTSAVSSRTTSATVKVAPNKNDLKKTESREITLGLRGDNTIEVRSGLNEGDTVVVERTAVSTNQTVNNNTGGTLTGSNTNVPGAGGFVPGAGAGGTGRTGGQTGTGGATAGATGR